jgi:hypothetical protein
VEETLKSTNLMTGNILVDEHVWPYRLPTLVGTCSAYMISRRLAKSFLENEDDVYGWIYHFISDFKFWEEAVAPAIFMASECLCMRGAELAGISMAMRAVETITRENGEKAKVGLPDPYFNAEDVMKVEMFGEDIYGEKVTFARRSYSIRQFVELDYASEIAELPALIDLAWTLGRRGVARDKVSIEEIEDELRRAGVPCEEHVLDSKGYQHASSLG